MILTCPNCSIRYLLDRHVLGPEGHLVRCSACGHVWRQDVPDEDEDESAYDFEYSEDVPEAVRPRPGDDDHALPPEERSITPVITGATAAALLFLALISLLVLVREPVAKTWPPSARLFETLGFELPSPGDGLIFDQVKAEIDWDGQGRRILRIRGKIINLRDEDVPLPPVRATWPGVKGGTAPVRAVEIPREILAPEEAIRFETVFLNVPGAEDADQIRIFMSLPEKTP